MLFFLVFSVSRHWCWAIKQGSGLDTSHNIQGRAAVCRDRRTPGSNYFPYSDQTTEDETINIIRMPVTPPSLFFSSPSLFLNSHPTCHVNLVGPSQEHLPPSASKEKFFPFLRYIWPFPTEPLMTCGCSLTCEKIRSMRPSVCCSWIPINNPTSFVHLVQLAWVIISAVLHCCSLGAAPALNGEWGGEGDLKRKSEHVRLFIYKIF